MITNVLIWAITLPFQIIIWIFSIIDYVFPEQIEQAVIDLLGYIKYASVLIPVDDLIQALIYYLTFLSLFYGLKVGLYAISFMTKVTHHTKLPTISNKTGKQ